MADLLFYLLKTEPSQCSSPVCDCKMNVFGLLVRQNETFVDVTSGFRKLFFTFNDILRDLSRMCGTKWLGAALNDFHLTLWFLEVKDIEMIQIFEFSLNSWKIKYMSTWTCVAIHRHLHGRNRLLTVATHLTTTGEILFSTCSLASCPSFRHDMNCAVQICKQKSSCCSRKG